MYGAKSMTLATVACQVGANGNCKQKPDCKGKQSRTELCEIGGTQPSSEIDFLPEIEPVLN